MAAAPAAVLGTTVHASAVLAGARAILIRGPAGAGKSRLALDLIGAAQRGLIPFARLVADDRIQLAAAHGRLLGRPPPVLAGLIEVRGLGIRRLPHEPVAVIGLLVDLASPDAERLPGEAGREVAVAGIILPRLVIGAGCDALAAVLARLLTAPAEV
jgi:serine kinase of HPr protein (carbohydrate metabolism regulator)